MTRWKNGKAKPKKKECPEKSGFFFSVKLRDYNDLSENVKHKLFFYFATCNLFYTWYNTPVQPSPPFEEPAMSKTNKPVPMTIEEFYEQEMDAEALMRAEAGADF